MSVLGAAPAWAADGDSPVRWSVGPANADGRDGRASFELVADPGERLEEHLAVTNLADRPAVFVLQSADGYFTEEGRFNMLADPSQSKDAGTWVKIESEVEVPAGETVVVPFEVVVPANAEPGDHAAGVAAALVRTGQGEDGSADVGVVSRFGVRVMIRVSGELKPGLEIHQLDASYQLARSPLRPGAMVARFELVNTGNARLQVTGTVTVQGHTVQWPSAGANRIELLPGEARRVEAAVGQVWPLFRVKTSVEAVPQVVALEGVEVPSLPPVLANLTVWAFPWPQLAVLVGVALIAWAWLAGRSRAKRRLARLLDQARAEERAKLSTPAASPHRVVQR
ncbi:MAG: hypothetical protein LBH68_09000 [Bifidobacteriaceae bacterium]|jgi:hypothetical protein|nr:hypothetical protein [Bifidobacteriaceae bacterium]